MSADAVPADGTADVFRFKGFTFDCGTQQLLQSGQGALHLSRKARQLLHILLVARPRAVSRETLYDALWPSTFVSETNLANVVNELRRALGDDARASQFIRTVHGFGYAWCEPRSSAKMAVRLVCNREAYKLHRGRNPVGRGADNHILIEAPTVSRCHAVITVSDDGIFVEDLGSTNGTFVDGRRIGGSPVALQANSQIAFGNVRASLDYRDRPLTIPLPLDPG